MCACVCVSAALVTGRSGVEGSESSRSWWMGRARQGRAEEEMASGGGDDRPVRMEGRFWLPLD